jgi:DNA-directed RNA polymerase specialized sigma24 family protein
LVEAGQGIARAEFELVSRTLVARAKHGAGRITRVPEADAEDVVQDAWEKELRKNPELPHGRRLRQYMHQAVVDTSAQHKRSRHLKRVIPPERQVPLDVASAAEVVGGDSEEQALAAICADEIFDALSEHLDEEAIDYAVLDALEYQEKEIAQAMEISPAASGAARKRVSRARGAIARSINYKFEPDIDSKEEQH